MQLDSHQLLQKARTLPSMSSVVQELSVLTNDARASSRDFEKVIRKDAGLAGRLLKLANSAAFGLAGRVSSIEHATMLLGVSRLLDVAMSASFSKLIPKQIPGYDISAREYWQHSIAVAILAERFAKHLRIALSSDAFTAGLLHDSGKLVLSAFFEKGSKDIAAFIAATGAHCHDAERQLLGTDHGEAGQVVIESWHLPPVLVQAARWHHQPSILEDDASRSLVGVVHLATLVAHRYQLTSVSDGEHLTPGAGEAMGFSDTELERIAVEARATVLEMTSAGQIG